MRRLAFFTALVAIGGTAQAADEPLYAPVPNWVTPAPPIDTSKLDANSPVVVQVDTQQRVENGGVIVYNDVATRVANAEVLRQLGTLAIPWQPAFGDLTVHRVEVIRGTKHIDLLAGGKSFSVLHREEQLESLQLNGMLTATMQVEGVQVGDVVRLTVSISRRDPTLRGNVDTAAMMPALPTRIGFGRLRLSWPDAAPLKWRVNAADVAPAVSDRAGFHHVEVSLPLAKRPEMPGDAPSRFREPPLLQASSFADWAAVSATMAALYKTDGLIPPGGPLVAEVARIEAAASDPFARAALALASVQGNIRYLANGMATGNYVPQTPTQTWTLRYGDCKAKTLLLLALLHAMNIEAQPVLATLGNDDALPQRLPSVSAFNHVLVKANINGRTLWLDGTDLGTRQEDLADTPPVRYVLPVQSTNARLMPIATVARGRADSIITVDIDSSAGLKLPAPYRASVVIRGRPAQQLQVAASQSNDEQREELIRSLLSGTFDDAGVLTNSKVSYDEKTGTATVTADGLLTTLWKRQDHRYQMILDRAADDRTLNVDRARAAWRSIPVATGGPSTVKLVQKVRLPGPVSAYTIDGDRGFAGPVDGTIIDRKVALSGDAVSVDDRLIATGAEIMPADLPAARAAAARAQAHVLTIKAPADYPARHVDAVRGMAGKKFGRILDIYAADIASYPNEARGYLNCAAFRDGVFDYRGALSDYDKAIEIEPSAANYLARAAVEAALGDDAKAAADIREALKLQPDDPGATGRLARLMAKSGKGPEALVLLQPLIDQGGKVGAQALADKAEVLAFAGDKAGAVAANDAALAETPGIPSLLNERCWTKATLGTGLDTALKDCTKALELTDDPAPILDSRAMAYFRMGRLADAKDDLDAALDQDGDIAASLYLRAVVRERQGDHAGAIEDARAARMIAPMIDADYRRWGIAAPR